MSAEIPEGWKRVPLSDLADYHNGRAFKPADWSRSGLPIIRIAQINKPDSETDYYSGDDIEGRHLIQNGDLLFSWSATLTAIKWQWGRGVVNQHIFKVVERTGVDRDFLFYTILNSIDALAEHSHGTTMKHIKKGVLKTYCVGLPPLPEQRRIAEILSSVDDAIAATQAVIDQTRTVKQGVLKRLLTKGIGHTRFKQTEIGEIPEEWEVGRLEDLVSVIDPQPDHRTPPVVENGVPYIGIGDIKENRIDFLNARRVSPSVLNAQMRAFDVHEGAFVFGKIGTIGEPAPIPCSREYCLSANLVLISSHVETYVRYVFHAIGSRLIYDQIRRGINTTSQPALGIKKIRKFLVPIPSKNEMEKMCEVMACFEAQTNTHRKWLNRLNETKSALMSDLLTGRKRVSIPEQDVAAAE